MKNKLVIKDINGNVLNYEIVGAFSSGNKNYLVYLDNVQVNGKKDMLVSSYTYDDEESITLEKINDEKEWEMINEHLSVIFEEDDYE